MTTIHVSTRAYRASHGKHPRGYGRWGFFFGDDADHNQQRHPWFVPYSAPFSQAKSMAIEEAKARKTGFVAVAP